jgi:hypothetical protein
LPNKPGALHPVASSTLTHWHAFIFSAYGREFKPPISRVFVEPAISGSQFFTTRTIRRIGLLSRISHEKSILVMKKSRTHFKIKKL